MMDVLDVKPGAAALAVLASVAFAPVAAAEMPNPIRHLADPLTNVPAQRAALPDGDEAMRVFGGVEAEPGAWPFQVALLATGLLADDPRSQWDAQFCGGSLIARNWVLTAAHCVADEEGNVYPERAITALLGATSLLEGERVAVASIHVHPDYDPYTISNDIALMRLEKAVDHPTVTLNRRPETPEAGPATAVGWGMTEHGTSPQHLLEAHIEMQSNAVCNAGIRAYLAERVQAYIEAPYWLIRFEGDAVNRAMRELDAGMRNPVSDESMICAGVQSGSVTVCYGDSGGPLLVEDENGGLVQVGISSWTVGPWYERNQCGHADSYAVFVRLGAYAGWIDGVVNAPQRPAPSSR